MSELETELEAAKPVIKKILAKKGQIEGYFYLTWGRGDIGLVVTLARRDETGKKALTRGKKLRRQVKGTKFARGILTGSEQRKAVFEIHGGNANETLVRKTLRKELSKTEGLDFLRKALVKLPDAELEDDTGEVDEAYDAVISLSDEEKVALQLTEEEAEELDSAISESWRATRELSRLLSSEDALADHEEFVNDLVKECEQLDQGSPEYAEAHAALLEALELTPAVAPEPGGRLDPGQSVVMDFAMDKRVEQLELETSKLVERVREIHDEVEGHDDSWRASHRDELIQELNRHRKALQGALEELESLS